MLVLTRRLGETIVIDGSIRITIVDIGKNGQIRIGVDAPSRHRVHRAEVFAEIQAEMRAAAAVATPLADALSRLDSGAPALPMPGQPEP